MSPTNKPTEFYPFFDPLRDGQLLPWGIKAGIALAWGVAYLLLQYYSLPDKMVFFQHLCWILGIIITTSTMALYVSTEVFRNSLKTLNQFNLGQNQCAVIVNNWLSDKWYVLAGLAFGTTNTMVGHTLGVPVEFYAQTSSLIAIYIGFFAAGFASGMGLLGIFAVIALYLRVAPSLQHALNPHSPDGTGGIKTLGDSLWFFGSLIGLVGLLVSIYMFGVSWSNLHIEHVQYVFLGWVSLPYILAVSIVLIPGLAVRRHVNYFKYYKTQQLKREKAKLYARYKKFDAADDEKIILEKKQLKDRLDSIQEELDKLEEMRASPLDR